MATASAMALVTALMVGPALDVIRRSVPTIAVHRMAHAERMAACVKMDTEVQTAV